MGKLLAGESIAGSEAGDDESTDDGIEGDDVYCSHCFLFLRLFLIHSMKSE